MIAGFTASVLSEEIKFVGRQTFDTKRSKNNTELKELIEAQETLEQYKDEDLDKKKSLISVPELAQDLTKWVAYDLLSNDNPTPLDGAVFGVLSGLISHSIYEILLPSTQAFRKGEVAFQPSDYIRIATRFLQAALEGGALFFSYEATLIVFQHYIPSEVSKPLTEDFTTYFELIQQSFTNKLDEIVGELFSSLVYSSNPRYL